MSKFKGKILFVIIYVMSLINVAASAFGGYKGGVALQKYAGNTLVSVDWTQTTIILTIACAVLALLLMIPSCIVAKQICNMYDVHKKAAKWSPLSITVTVLFVLISCVAGYYTVMKIGQYETILKAMHYTNILQIKIIGCAIAVYACNVITIPIVLSLRMRDSVTNLKGRREKRKAFEETEE